MYPYPPYIPEWPPPPVDLSPDKEEEEPQELTDEDRQKLEREIGELQNALDANQRLKATLKDLETEYRNRYEKSDPDEPPEEVFDRIPTSIRVRNRNRPERVPPLTNTEPREVEFTFERVAGLLRWAVQTGNVDTIMDERISGIRGAIARRQSRLAGR
jgi:hypothetical protein